MNPSLARKNGVRGVTAVHGDPHPEGMPGPSLQTLDSLSGGWCTGASEVKAR